MPRKQRVNWGKDHQVLPTMDLIELQRQSYDWFLKTGIKLALEEVNAESGGIEDFTGKNWLLSFGDYRFGEPKYTAAEAKNKAVTYDMPLYVEATLVNKKTGATQSQEVFLADIPKMTPVGTFVINGIERAVVTQLVRSPGVFFSGDEDESRGRVFYKAELRPLRGSWLEINVGKRDVISIKIDRRRKMPVTVLLRAIGFGTDEELMALFKEELENDEFDLLKKTIDKDTTKSEAEALIELYEKMRPGEPAVLDTAREYLEQLFFDPRRYDLGEVGRYKLNRRLKQDNVKSELTVLSRHDVVNTVKYLIGLQNGRGKVDDIDHLSNRRVRRIGELVKANALRIGLLRLERSIREKMSLTKTDETLTPAALVNARPVIATISEFFRRNRLSTILDQTNPLSEVDNLRRLSVMGSGGVTRERASFSMRDINASQYSRIDPVRSPEGPNIGLVTYLALYARVNHFGFLEAPYRQVEMIKGKAKVTDEVVYMSADEEEDYKITHASIDIDDRGYITQDWVPMRHSNQFIEGPVEEVDYIDVVPRQVIGTSASLIPFIAHDEANRALMGTHMQCQAVPLVKAEAPVVGTGMEEVVATAMGRTAKARHGGQVEYVDGDQVVIKVNKSELDSLKKTDDSQIEEISIDRDREIYHLTKFERTSNSTCYSQRPIVEVGDKVKKGEVIIDGPSADQGELALGSNLLIAYSAFEGLGYEDAIVISDRLVREDVLTSIHISEHRSKVMDTKLGPEELTNDIPNVSENYLANLTDDGIIRIGSEIESGDILVGKIAPKGETELTPEERLLRAIFGEKSREVRDTSLRLPHGTSGTVIDVRILDRDKGDELDPGTLKEVIVKVAETRKITVGDKLAGRHGNKGVISKIVPQADMPYLEDGTAVDIIISPLSVLARMNMGQLLEASLGWAAQLQDHNVAVPAFEKIDEELIWEELDKIGLPKSGKVQLYDGRTGEAFKESTVVGIGYILKLIHMVEDKVHARSTGPYSLVTQQPLGGKAQMGGQRLGEMEVWALEAHRAAHTLQEMLTIKSDDVMGRSRAFEAMVKGEDIPAPTVPESFKVLVRELNSLGLEILPHEVQEDVDQDLTATEGDETGTGSATNQTASADDDQADDQASDQVDDQTSDSNDDDNDDESDPAEKPATEGSATDSTSSDTKDEE